MNSVLLLRLVEEEQRVSLQIIKLLNQSTNLGWASKYEDKKFTMGLGEFSYSVHSEVLTKQELRDAFSATISGDSLSTFTYDEKLKAAQEFANSGMALDMDLGSFGFAYNDEKFGGIAFRINDQFNWYSRFNETTSEILFLGKLAPYFDSLVYVDPTSLDTSQIANYENISQDSMQHVVSGFTNSINPISEIINGTQIFSWMRDTIFLMVDKFLKLRITKYLWWYRL